MNAVSHLWIEFKQLIRHHILRGDSWLDAKRQPKTMDIGFDSRGSLLTLDLQLLKMQRAWHIFTHIVSLQNMFKAALVLVSIIAVAPRVSLLRRAS